MSKMEVIIGLVSPMGCNKKPFITKITTIFEKKGYLVKSIHVTDLLYKEENDYPHSLNIYCKMQLCNELRTNYRGSIAALIINEINRIRTKESESKDKIVYIIDQLKNEAEYEILSHVYGLNYLQISLFSNFYERDKTIRKRLASDNNLEKLEIEDTQILENIFKDNLPQTNIDINKLKSKISIDYSLIERYKNQILKDCSHMLIEKDYKDIDKVHRKSGQQISSLFHRSHYFINLDSPESILSKEIYKFLNQFFGEYKDYPTQDEFGMAVAYHASFRSNFPGDRHIGASIIAENGEIISIGSIRAPSSSSNTKLSNQDSITEGYTYYYKKIDQWIEELDHVDTKSKEEICTFLKDSIEFHPCTHAEISAIIDAAKIGVSVKNGTLYTTTFPCHLCAKDIITAGIKKVVFLEAYPKSKSKELYPSIIDLHSQQRKDIIPFENFMGVSPSRYHYVYSLSNKPKALLNEKNDVDVNIDETFSPYLKFIRSSYYERQESDIIIHFTNYLDNNMQSDLSYLDSLVHKNN